jgi:hypothetical protein
MDVIVIIRNLDLKIELPKSFAVAKEVKPVVAAEVNTA